MTATAAFELPPRITTDGRAADAALPKREVQEGTEGGGTGPQTKPRRMETSGRKGACARKNKRQKDGTESSGQREEGELDATVGKDGMMWIRKMNEKRTVPVVRPGRKTMHGS